MWGLGIGQVAFEVGTLSFAFSPPAESCPVSFQFLALPVSSQYLVCIRGI